MGITLLVPRPVTGTIDVGNASVLVTLQGSYNVVTGGTGNVSVAGGLSHHIITLGSADDAIHLAPHAHHDSACWAAATILSQQSQRLGPCVHARRQHRLSDAARPSQHGARQWRFRYHRRQRGRARQQSRVRVHGSQLLEIGNAGGTVDITGFPVVCGTVCLATDLGFATPADAASAVTSDGLGGSMLVLSGGLGSIDFQNVAPGALHAGNFVG